MKRLKKMIVPITFIFAIIVTLVSQNVNVNASVNSYIKESKFKGNYYAQGKYSKLGYSGSDLQSVENQFNQKIQEAKQGVIALSGVNLDEQFLNALDVNF